MDLPETEGLTGKLLIAMPGIDDERFEKSVILLCAHTEDHAMGIVLNKEMDDLRLPELLDQLNVPVVGLLPDAPVLQGGPVGQDRGFVIHTEDFESIGATVPITNTLRLTATKEILKAIASTNPPERSRLALGYSGWGPNQLEAELKLNVWLVADSDEGIIFDTDFDAKWEKAVKKLGVTPAQIQSGMSGSA